MQRFWYFMKWVRRYGWKWSFLHIHFILTSFLYLEEIANKFNAKVEWKYFVSHSRMRKTYTYIFEMCKDYEHKLGRPYEKKIKDLCKVL